MDAFPAFFPLAGRTVVIAGCNEAADAKARLFDGSPATVVRIEGDAAFRPESYRGAALAFIAFDDDGFAASAAQAARMSHVPVNVVDRPALCDFTTPSVIDRGEVVAAIGTGGASPMLATLLRNDLETRIPEGAGRVAALFQGMKGEVKAALPQAHVRRAFLRAALNGEAAKAAMAGDMPGAVDLLRAALATGGVPAGEVIAVDARGPAEDLTLKTTRLLAGADVLVCAAGIDPAVVALARRDARRIEASDITPQEIAELVADGQRVVRLTA